MPLLRNLLFYKHRYYAFVILSCRPSGTKNVVAVLLFYHTYASTRLIFICLHLLPEAR